MKGSHPHPCLPLHQPLQAPGAERPPLGEREGGEEDERRCLSCSAGGPLLGDRARSREILTAQRRLSSFSRSLSDGTRVTRGLLCPSGVLWSGKAQGKSWVSPRPPLLPCLESWGAVFPRPAGSIPPAYPSSVSTHCSFRAQELQKERRHSVRPRSPQPVGRGGCLHTPTPWGRAQGQDGAPRGGAEVLPKAWLPLSCHPAHTDAFALPFWGPKGGQGMQEVAMPPSLPAGVLPVPWPGSARGAEATHRVAWAQLGTSPARPWDVAPRLTQSRQRRSQWARRG